MNKENSTRPYRSCYNLESRFISAPHGLVFCCDRITPAEIIPVNDPAKAVDDYLETRERLIRENQGDNPPCAGCNLFQEYEKTDGKIKQISFGTHIYCQFSCIYCELQHGDAQYKNMPEEFNALAIAKELKRRGLLSSELHISFASGEVTLHPLKNEYYDFIEENATKASFDSNAGIFDPRIARILSLTPKNFLLVSIDAGTEETFRRVKGVDMFKKVLANLAEYRKFSPSVYLKYILLDENCGDEDLEGFIQICRDLKINLIFIAGDLTKSFASWTSSEQLPYEENIVSAAIKLVKMAIESDIRFVFETFLGPANMREIYRRIAALPEAVAAKRQLDKTLSAGKLVCYGAGGNCEVELNKMEELGLRMPDVIWDRNAQPGQTLVVGEREYPVCRPDFDLLSGGGLRCIQFYQELRDESAA